MTISFRRARLVWRSSDFQALAYQGVAALMVVAFGWFLFDNLFSNLEKRGITTGFAFLQDTAGFGIVSSLIPYSEESTYGRAFLVGLLNTLLLSSLGILFSTLIGFTIGIARLSSNWLVATLAGVYVETVRNIPLLLQIFFWYFAVLAPLPGPRQSLDLWDLFFLNNRGLYLPSPVFGSGAPSVAWALVAALVAMVLLFVWAERRRIRTGNSFPALAVGLGILAGLPLLVGWLHGDVVAWDLPVKGRFNLRGGLVIIPEFTAVLLALSIYTGAFIAEVVRGGLLAVKRGQIEAAESLGLRQGQILRLVVIPQALRVIIPPLTNQYLNLTKNSSLAAAIAYPELVAVFSGTVLNQTGQAIEVLAITMGVYLLISLFIALVMNAYNRRTALVER